MAHMWDSALHSEPTLHGNSAWPELHRSSQWSEISRPDHCSTIDNFDRSFAWLEPSHSVSTSHNWIIHQSASSLWHRSWNRVVHLLFYLSSCGVSFIFFTLWSFKFFPQVFIVYFMPLNLQNFPFYPPIFEIWSHALQLLKFRHLPSIFWNSVLMPSNFWHFAIYPRAFWMPLSSCFHLYSRLSLLADCGGGSNIDCGADLKDQFAEDVVIVSSIDARSRAPENGCNYCWS